MASYPDIIERTRDRLVKRFDDGRLLLVLGCLTLAACLAVRPAQGTWSELDALAEVGDLLGGGGWLGDAAQDVLGFRRLVEHRDPYPRLGPALLEIGVHVPPFSPYPAMGGLGAVLLFLLPPPAGVAHAAGGELKGADLRVGGDAGRVDETRSRRVAS